MLCCLNQSLRIEPRHRWEMGRTFSQDVCKSRTSQPWNSKSFSTPVFGSVTWDFPMMISWCSNNRFPLISEPCAFLFDRRYFKTLSSTQKGPACYFIFRYSDRREYCGSFRFSLFTQLPSKNEYDNEILTPHGFRDFCAMGIVPWKQSSWLRKLLSKLHCLM
jgi:hypothetical protein